MREKFVVEYVPQSKIDKMLEEHKERMKEDGITSLWDIEDMMGHEECFEFTTREEAEAKAKKVLPLDHFGQVIISREIVINEGSDLEPLPTWNEVERAYHSNNDEPFNWERS